MATRYDNIEKRLKVNRAEQIAEGYFAKLGNILPFGFTQTHEVYAQGIVSRIPMLIRKAPDFIFIPTHDDVKTVFIEVKGMADRERTFNLKIDDFAGYCFWNQLMPLQIFSVKFKKDGEELYLTDFRNLKKLINENENNTGYYEDTHKRYFRIEWDSLNKID